jgi:hypothetical protein
VLGKRETAKLHRFAVWQLSVSRELLEPL